MSLTLNKSTHVVWRVYYPAVVLLEDLPTWEELWWPWLGGRANLRNSHESIIVYMIFKAQLTGSIDGDLLCVSFINI